MVVTGATYGIGRETARELVRRGASVIVHGRRAPRAREVAAELAAIAGDKTPIPEPVVGDFASLDDVRRMAKELLERGDGIATSC